MIGMGSSPRWYCRGLVGSRSINPCLGRGVSGGVVWCLRMASLIFLVIEVVDTCVFGIYFVVLFVINISIVNNHLGLLTNAITYIL
jgi:hypothetical protein